MKPKSIRSRNISLDAPGAVSRICHAVLAGLLVVHAASGCKSQQPASQPQKQPAALAAAAPAASPQPRVVATPQSPSGSQPQADGTWSQYANDRYNYTIKYPSSAELNKSDPSHVVIKFAQPFGQGQDVLTFNLVVHGDSKGLTAEQWALKQWEADSIKEQGPAQLGNHSAFRVKAWEEDEDTNHIYLAESARIYELSYVDPSSVAELAKEDQVHLADVFQKITESFALRTNAREP